MSITLKYTFDIAHTTKLIKRTSAQIVCLFCLSKSKLQASVTPKETRICEYANPSINSCVLSQNMQGNAISAQPIISNTFILFDGRVKTVSAVKTPRVSPSISANNSMDKTVRINADKSP